VYRAGNSKQGTTEERKKAIIKTLLDKDDYSKAIMYDDARPNLHTFIELKQDHPRTKFYAWHVNPEGKASEYMRESMVSEKRKRKSRWAAYGPGPYGGYGFAAGYSGDGGIGEGKKDSDELAKYENDVKTLLANGDVKTAKKVAGLSPDAAHRNRLRNIIRRYDSKQGVAEGEYKKLSTQEKLKRNLKRAGYDVDASVKRIDDLIAKQKKSREEFEKRHQNKEKDVAEANYFNPLDQERGEQAYSDREKREFKRRELQHELGHETNNVSIDINGKTWKVLKGEAEYPQRALARAAKIAATIKSNAVARGRKEPDVKVYVTGAPATD